MFGKGGVVPAAKELGVPFLGAIPLDPRVVVGGDAGTPVGAALDAADPVAQAFNAVAAELTAQIAGQGDAAPAMKITR